MSGHVVVIGGGIGGLSAAIRLAANSLRVTLLEKNERLGGKLNCWIAPHPRRPDDRPFRFDTGPTLLTMPYVFMDLFAAAGLDVRAHLQILKVDPVSRFRWADGMTFHLYGDIQQLQREIRRVFPDDLDGFRRFYDRGRRIWQLGEQFLSRSPDQACHGMGFHPWRMLTLPLRLGLFGKMAKLIDRHVRHPRLRDVLYQYATYSGAGPWRAPATLACIPYVEQYYGGWHIAGGMYRLAEQLELAARNLGVDIRARTPVTQVLIERSSNGRGRRSGAVVGVLLSHGAELRADAVLVNADVVYAYRELIPPPHRPRYDDAQLERFDPGGSGMILLLGVQGTYPQLAHHTKFMPDDYRADLRAMFQTRTIPDDPCIYVCAPTRTDSQLAPDGCENLFVLCSAPPLTNRAIDWSVDGPRYRDRIIHTLENRWGLTDLSRRIVVQRILTPLDLHHAYNANAGSIYGIAGHSLRTALRRPTNRDRHVRGLYFCGGGVHPGGGLPLVALSGKIASDLVLEDLAR